MLSKKICRECYKKKILQPIEGFERDWKRGWLCCYRNAWMRIKEIKGIPEVCDYKLEMLVDAQKKSK